MVGTYIDLVSFPISLSWFVNVDLMDNKERVIHSLFFPQVVILRILVTVCQGSPVPQNIQLDSQNMVPGVFISTDALKELQEKAHNQPNNILVDQNGNLKVSNYPLTANSDSAISIQQGQPIVGTSQPLMASSQPVVGSAQIASRPLPVSNTQQILVDPASQLVTNAQPILSQQPSIVIPNNQNQYLLSQPSQLSNPPNQIFVSQPSNQPVLLSSVSQPTNQVLIAQTPLSQQMLVNQLNQPIHLNQPTNQPTYVSQPQNQQILLNPQSSNQQILMRQSNQPTLVYQNRQPALINNPPSDQVTMVARPPNTMQNPGTVYAMVPINNVQSVPNVNGNTYLLPSNSNQVYTIGSG